MTHRKIVSLLPAATEIVCALGFENELVGRSHECDYPEHVKDLPVCSAARFTSPGDSAAINQQVLDILANALSIYTIDKDAIRQLDPDIIITQAQCEVCAVSLRDVEHELAGLLKKDCRIISLSPGDLKDVFADINAVGDALGAPDAAEHLLVLAQERIDLVRHKLKFITDRPQVACIEWLSPLMVAGNWTPEMVDIAGGNAILATAGKHSPFVSFGDILTEDPQILVLMPCGFSIGRTMQEIHLLLEQPGFSGLRAVKENRIYIADGNQYFNRSGPRIVDSIEILAEIINPKQFMFGYEGNGWVKFEVGASQY